MASASEIALIKRTIVATCEKLAEWLEVDDGMAVLAIAREVKAFDGWAAACCTVCQETTCDEGCPLAPVRNAGAADEDSEAEWRARIEASLTKIAARLDGIAPRA